MDTSHYATVSDGYINVITNKSGGWDVLTKSDTSPYIPFIQAVREKSDNVFCTFDYFMEASSKHISFPTMYKGVEVTCYKFKMLPEFQDEHYVAKVVESIVGDNK